MKTILAILMCFIVAEAPVLAIHGGYTLGGSADLTGTYAGILIPTSETAVTSGTSAATGLGANALGIFTFGVPKTGIGTGTVTIFASAQQLVGVIQVLSDPRSTGQLIGVISATGEVTTATASDNLGFTASSTQITGEASGDLVAAVDQSSNSPLGTELTGTSNLSVSTSVTGTDGVTTFTPTENVVFAIDGFLQSTEVTTSSSVTSGS